MEILNNVYVATGFPSQRSMAEIANDVGTSVTLVKKWFQIKRDQENYVNKGGFLTEPELTTVENFLKKVSSPTTKDMKLLANRINKDCNLLTSYVRRRHNTRENILEQFYEILPRPNPTEMEILADITNKQTSDVYNWFYNKRKKDQLDNCKTSMKKNLTNYQIETIKSYCKDNEFPSEIEIENLSIQLELPISLIKIQINKIKSLQHHRQEMFDQCDGHFTFEQLIVLKSLFSQTPYPSVQEIENLAKQFNLEDCAFLLFRWFDMKRKSILNPSSDDDVQIVDFTVGDLSEYEVQSYLANYAKHTPYPSIKEVQKLSKKLKRSTTAIKHWFSVNVQSKNLQKEAIRKRATKSQVKKSQPRKISTLFYRTKTQTGNNRNCSALVKRSHLGMAQIRPCFVKLTRCDKLLASPNTLQRMKNYIRQFRITATEENISKLSQKFRMCKSVVKEHIIKWQTFDIEIHQDADDSVLEEEKVIPYNPVENDIKFCPNFADCEVKRLNAFKVETNLITLVNDQDTDREQFNVLSSL